MTDSSYSMPADIRFGTLALTVADLARSLAFYEGSIGMHRLQREGNTARLGDRNGLEILRLTENASARTPTRATGLYHFAILLPSRAHLALALQHMMSTGVSMEGFSDHGVSEALYLSDPDGNGIEIYRDRPRDEWPFQDGEMTMTTNPLDLNGLMAEVQGSQAAWRGLPDGTITGHIHLRVASIPAAEAFYTEQMGFDLMQRYGIGASFVSAGGYHHHIGFNTWQSAGAPPPPPGSLGLRYFTLRLPSRESLDQLVNRLKQAGTAVEERDGGFAVRDPAGNQILLTT